MHELIALIVSILALVMATASIAIQVTLLTTTKKDKEVKEEFLDEEVEAFLNYDGDINNLPTKKAPKQKTKDDIKLEEALSDDAPYGGIDEEFGL